MNASVSCWKLPNIASLFFKQLVRISFADIGYWCLNEVPAGLITEDKESARLGNLNAAESKVDG